MSADLLAVAVLAAVTVLAAATDMQLARTARVVAQLDRGVDRSRGTSR